MERRGKKKNRLYRAAPKASGAWGIGASLPKATRSASKAPEKPLRTRLLLYRKKITLPAALPCGSVLLPATLLLLVPGLGWKNENWLSLSVNRRTGTCRWRRSSI